MPLPLIAAAVLPLVTKYAPGLIRHFAGESAGAVADQVAGAVKAVTGTADYDQAGAALDADPELAQQFRLRLADLQLDLERVAAADRADARQREIQTRDWTPRLLALLVTLGFFGVLIFMLLHGKPETGGDALLVMLGALGGAWSAIISYYYGSSAGSARKTELLRG